MGTSRVIGLLFGLMLCSCNGQSRGLSGPIVDLTHSFDEQTVYWPTAKGFVLEQGSAGYNEKGYYYEAHSFCAAEHGGTHVDAPIHFFEGRRSLESIPLEQLVGPGAVVDVSAQCSDDRDYRVTSADLHAWERKHDKTLDNHFVLLRTGFGRYWPDRIKYMGTDERGADAVSKLHFPGLHPEAAQWLVQNRRIKAIGLDTPSIDHGQSTHFESHVTLCEHNVPIFENVANLQRLPESGFKIIALPMKIKGGSGGPLRIIAIVSD